jgi:hypothetical protein
MIKPEHPWFVYQRTVGRISGRPSHWKGWLALMGTIIMIGVAGTAWMRWLITAGRPIVAGVGLGAMILLGVAGLIRLMLAKGERIG